MSQTGPEEQPGIKAKQHDDEDAEGHAMVAGAEPGAFAASEQPGAMAAGEQPGVFSQRQDEDDTEGQEGLRARSPTTPGSGSVAAPSLASVDLGPGNAGTLRSIGRR